MASGDICLSTHAPVVHLLALPESLQELVTDTSGSKKLQAMCKACVERLNSLVEVGTTHVGPWEILKEASWHPTYDSG